MGARRAGLETQRLLEPGARLDQAAGQEVHVRHLEQRRGGGRRRLAARGGELRGLVFGAPALVRARVQRHFRVQPGRVRERRLARGPRKLAGLEAALRLGHIDRHETAARGAAGVVLGPQTPGFRKALVHRRDFERHPQLVVQHHEEFRTHGQAEPMPLVQAGVEQQENVAGNVDEARAHADAAEERRHEHGEVVAISGALEQRLARVIDLVDGAAALPDRGIGILRVRDVGHAERAQGVEERGGVAEVPVVKGIAGAAADLARQPLDDRVERRDEGGRGRDALVPADRPATVRGARALALVGARQAQALIGRRNLHRNGVVAGLLHGPRGQHGPERDLAQRLRPEQRVQLGGRVHVARHVDAELDRKLAVLEVPDPDRAEGLHRVRLVDRSIDRPRLDVLDPHLRRVEIEGHGQGQVMRGGQHRVVDVGVVEPEEPHLDAGARGQRRAVRVRAIPLEAGAQGERVDREDLGADMDPVVDIHGEDRVLADPVGAADADVARISDAGAGAGVVEAGVEEVLAGDAQTEPSRGGPEEPGIGAEALAGADRRGVQVGVPGQELGGEPRGERLAEAEAVGQVDAVLVHPELLVVEALVIPVDGGRVPRRERQRKGQVVVLDVRPEQVGLRAHDLLVPEAGEPGGVVENAGGVIGDGGEGPAHRNGAGPQRHLLAPGGAGLGGRQAEQQQRRDEAGCEG